jgi:hypothetical protein
MSEFFIENLFWWILCFIDLAVAIGMIIKMELKEKRRIVRCHKCGKAMIRHFSLRGEDRFCNTCGYGIHISYKLGAILNFMCSFKYGLRKGEQ